MVYGKGIITRKKMVKFKTKISVQIISEIREFVAKKLQFYIVPKIKIIEPL